ncbi:MAG: hypothetical protein IT561_23800 [Alphaproteobacteria bacterium]|nr:hypothetical protein [Alphaproteobacteria bacterium]
MGYFDARDGELGKWDLQAINELYGPERDKAVDDTIYGGDSINQLLGGPGRDMLFGNSGDDFIYGGRDNDTLFGGRGNDIVSGDVGDDDISGDAGDDVLTGGAGRDTFRVGAGNDVITDFAAAVDRVVATGAYTIAHEGHDTLLLGDDWSARLVGIADFA